MLDGHEQAVSFNQFVEDLLENLFGVAWVWYAAADEVAQPRLLPRDHFGDPLVLFKHHLIESRRFVHL
jgi:hypothetical protein